MNGLDDIRLDGAFKETPAMCREAVTKAVSSYKEEERMKRPLMTAIAIAMILILLCGTAFALVNYYSVRDAVAKGTPSRQFERHIIPIESSKTAEGITVSLGDAVFDGSHLDFTVQLSAAADAAPMALIPMLKGSYQGQALGIDYRAGHAVSLTEGFVYPGTDPRYPVPESYTVSAECDDLPGEPVEWQYTVQVLRPKWEIVQAPEYVDWEQYEAAFLAAWQDGKIMLSYGTDVEDYADAIVDSLYPERPDFGESYIPFTLLDSGAFELVDTLTFEFVTGLPENQKAQGDNIFRFDGYDVEVKEITVSFMRVNYLLELRFAQPQPNEYDLDFFFDLFDQDGNKLEWKSSTLSLQEDHMTAKLWGSVEYISDTPLTAITFKPSDKFNIDFDKALDESLWFTVSLD